jgi:hypothetical protein
MESRKNIFKLNRSQWISVAVLASSLGVAAAVSLTTFTPGTTISATAVNANLTALNNALPQVWASTDSASAGTTVTPATSTPQTINTVSINVPTSGHLIISGSAFVNNGSVAALYNLIPLIDGVSPGGPVFAATVFTQGDTGGVGADIGSLAYTMTVPVTTGAHTVSQQIFAVSAAGTPASVTFFYNANNLTVVYVPQISGFVTAQAPSGAPTPATEGKAATPQEEFGL